MRMKAYRKIGVLLLILVVVMQFIQPKKNISETVSDNDISRVYALPEGLHETFMNKCYDCHSNNTRYPWYFNIQPIGWWLAAHVHDGKEELNFSEFKNYEPKKATHKLEEIGEVIAEEVIADGSMPLKAYTLFHEDSKITPEETAKINDWLASLNIKPH
jgi:hypothetical protein